MSFSIIRAVRFHVAMAAVLVISVFLYLVVDTTKVHFLLLIFLAGAAGGVTNTYERMRKVPAKVNEFSNSTVNMVAIIQVYVSPVIAGVFGVVLYSLFLTDLLSGTLFPSFVGQDDAYQGVVHLFNKISPKEQIDAAKSVVWAFVAGFSERFVPNIIDKLAHEVEPDSCNKDE